MFACCTGDVWPAVASGGLCADKAGRRKLEGSKEWLSEAISHQTAFEQVITLSLSGCEVTQNENPK